jgi:hypothetical protein
MGGDPGARPVCDYEGSDYQERFWERGGRAYEDRVEAIAMRRLLPRSGVRLLEIGAGAGRNTPRYTGFSEIVLLDYSRTQLEQARDRLGGGDRYVYVVADVYRMPFGEAVFDAATMIRTLHHMLDPKTALTQIRASLTSGAAFILEYANKRNLKAILRWLARRQGWNPFSHAPVEFAPLNFDFHPAFVRGQLKDSGFEVERQLTVSHLRLGALKRTLPIGLLVAVDSMLQFTGALWQYTPSVFLRARAGGEPSPVKAEIAWRCPDCGGSDLGSTGGGLLCTACGRLWALRDGIYEFK